MADQGVRSVAVLGTGIMGAPIARNMAEAGLTVAAWNRTREKAEPLSSHGVEIADSPSAAARERDAVLTMLSGTDAVETVMTGDDGALAAMGDDAIWIQSSTVGIRATERLAELAAHAGVTFVDSPVLGTRQPAEQGELVVLGSGPDEARERCKPVFEAIGRKTLWLGEAGAGTRMKLVLNSWLLALTAGLGETLALAQALDVDPASFLETIDGAPMGSPYAQLKGKAMIERSYETSFPLQLAEKDAALILEAAEPEGLDPKIARAVHERFERAAELGHGEEDMAAVHEAYDRAE
jgi:3-hydroxyisobutyrate dehydrogenase